MCIDHYNYRSVQAITHTLGPYETLLYTWDDHTGKKLIKWDLLDVKVNNGKPINVNKVNRIFVKCIGFMQSPLSIKLSNYTFALVHVTM